MRSKKATFEQKLIHAGILDPWEYLAKLYDKGFSTNELQEKLSDDYKIKISSRYLSSKISKITKIRNKSEQKKIAIKRGRMVYYKKPEHLKYKSTGLSHKKRLEVLSSAKFRCKLCGNSVKNGAFLEIHHKDGNPKNNNIKNLQVLCFSCHRGIHST